MNPMIEQFDRMAMNLFLSLSLQAVLKENFTPKEKILEEWMKEQICSTAQTLFRIPAEA